MPGMKRVAMNTSEPELPEEISHLCDSIALLADVLLEFKASHGEAVYDQAKNKIKQLLKTMPSTHLMIARAMFAEKGIEL